MTAPHSQSADQTGLDLPRLAVVLPCYNSESWVARSVGSVLAQDYPDLLVIAVDDGSTDGTLAALQAFGDAITVETGPNRGACHARNRGLTIATERGAEYVVFLDADDHFEGPILRHAATVAVQTGADLVVSDMVVLDMHGVQTENRRYSGQIAPETIFLSRLSPGPLVPGGVLWRRSFVEQLGWDESLSKGQDTDLMMRAMLRRPLVMKNDTGVVFYMSVNPQSITRARALRHFESQFRVYSAMLAQVPGTSFAPAIPLLSARLHRIAWQSFWNGYIDLGRQVVRAVTAASTRGSPLEWKWAMLIRLIGLETRTRLRRQFASYRERPAPRKTGVAP